MPNPDHEHKNDDDEKPSLSISVDEDEVDDVTSHTKPVSPPKSLQKNNISKRKISNLVRLTKKPANTLELGDCISHDMNDYHREGEIKGGSNSHGQYAGKYRYYYKLADATDSDIHSTLVIFKQDMSYDSMVSKKLNRAPLIRKILPPLSYIPKIGPKLVINHDKNIAEYVAGKLMNTLIGDSAATIFYATEPKDKKIQLPDETGENIYIGSIVYENFGDLYKDIYQIQGKSLPLVGGRPWFAGTLRKKTFERGLLEEDKKSCRFSDFEKITVCSLFVGDFDVHSGNYGVIAERDAANKLLFDDNGNIVRNKHHKIGRLVKIDHASAFKNLEDEVHMHSVSRHDPMKGPGNHFRGLPDALKFSQPFAEELTRIANFDRHAMKQTIDSAIDETTHYYGPTPFLTFIKHMVGNDPAFHNLTAAQHKDAAVLAAFAKDFLIKKMVARQESLRKLAFNIKLSICIERLADGTFEFKKNAPYKMEELLKEYPDYFASGKFDFKGSDKKDIKYEIPILNLPVTSKARTKPILEALTRQKSKTAAVNILEKALSGEEQQHLHQHRNNYRVTFYNYTDNKYGIDRIVISNESKLKQTYPEIHHREKTSRPILTAEWSAQLTDLKKGEYAINFINDNKPTAGEKPYFIEHVTAAGQYRITAHRLPPEIDKGELFGNILLQHCAGNEKMLKQMCRHIRVENNTIESSSFNAFLQKVADKKLVVDITSEQLKQELHQEYLKRATQTLDNQIIPSESYLQYAFKQWQLLQKAKGCQTKIRIPDGPDKMLMLSYKLIFEAFNVRCDEKSSSSPQPVLDYIKGLAPSEIITSTLEKKPLR